ncbi:MAG: LamG domain-containing protein [Bacteroidales bacterium]|nr:LamG domain-containing protein [Bacteroidales bacterium]
MRTFKLTFLIVLFILSIEFVKANNEQPRGIDLGEYAFGIPAKQLNFDTYSKFTLSFWINVKELNHTNYGTLFASIRNPEEQYVFGDYGWMWSFIEPHDSKNTLNTTIRSSGSSGFDATTLSSFNFEVNEWLHFSFVFDYDTNRSLLLYMNGTSIYEVKGTYETYEWVQNNIIMIGGVSALRSPLNAYVDKVQFYNKALSEAEVKESMIAPLNDASLLGYWDFENGCTTDAEGYMMADKGTIKATMYKILQQNDISIGTEIQPFTFAEGVNPESVLQGVEESTAEESNTRAYVSNGVLYIENAECINSVTVYDAMGRVLLTPNPSPAERGEIAIPLNLNVKGLLLVKVNNEVVKVICE